MNPRGEVRSVAAETSISGLKSFKFNRWEFAGAFGDLGTLLPLLIALITINGMHATSVFFVAGLAYILSGLVFRLPVPVQPLKAMTAIAIASGMSASVISASGIIMAMLMLLLAATGFIKHLARLFPLPVIRGIQLGVGLFLLKSGLSLIISRQVVIGGNEAFVSVAHFSVPVSLLLAIGGGIALLLMLKNRRLPPALLLLTAGIGAGLVWGSFSGLNTVRLGFSLPSFSLPGWSDLSAALLILVIPQVPLTLANAVFATTNTAKKYFGGEARRVTPRALLSTMGAANLAAGLLGGVPICHGSGGMTAHYRFGARTGGAMLIIGGLFIVLAVALDGNILPVISLIPYSVLGVLTAFVGVEHALLARDMRTTKDVSVTAVISLTAIITSNLALGFAAGMALHFIFQTAQRLTKKPLPAAAPVQTD